MAVDRQPPLSNEFFKYRAANPQCVFGRTMLPMQITIPSGGVAVPIITAERPKLYMIANIHANEPFFIGGDGITTSSGFPMTKELSPLVFGLMENTTLWGCAVNAVTCYIMDLGL